MEYVAAALLGFVGGTLGGLVGVGGGILFVPALAIFLDQSQIHAEATSLLAIVFVALVGAWRQRGYGNVRVRDGLLVGALSPLGVVAGVVISNAVPERTLELLFAALVLVFAVQLLRRARTSPTAPGQVPSGPGSSGAAGPHA
jgi:uncharacterized membrane protein YfcA